MKQCLWSTVKYYGISWRGKEITLSNPTKGMLLARAKKSKDQNLKALPDSPRNSPQVWFACEVTCALKGTMWVLRFGFIQTLHAPRWDAKVGNISFWLSLRTRERSKDGWNDWITEWFELEGTLKDHLVLTSLPLAGAPTNRSGCERTHSICPWKIPGMGHPQTL